MFRFLQKSIAYRILAAIGLVGMISLGVVGVISVNRMESSLIDQNRINLEKMIHSASLGLQNLMLAGANETAKEYAEDLKSIEGLEDFRIFRNDGSIAFQEEMGSQSIKDDTRFKQALTSKDTVIYSDFSEEGVQRMNFLVPVLNREPCQACHGDDHEVRGVFRVSISLQETEEKIASLEWELLGVLIISMLAFLVTLVWIIRSTLRVRLEKASQTIQEIAEGDLTRRVTIKKGPLDEVGFISYEINQMASSFAQMIKMLMLQTHSMSACVRELTEAKDGLASDSSENYQLAKLVVSQHEQVEESVQSINHASSSVLEEAKSMADATEQLNQTVVTIANNAEVTSHNVSTMASAAEQMSANIAGVNSSLQSVNHSVNTVVSAVDEMNQALDTVRHRCEKATERSNMATANVGQAADVMHKLVDSAKEIDNVVEVINSIAEQTNMLALNASIEAAGAGEAGKGFAVVANEVKDLARQTGDATRMISNNIQEIQQRTDEAMDVVSRTVHLIEEINESNESITESVDEQSATTHGISSAINTVSTASGEVTRNAEELEAAAHEVARAAAESASGSHEIATAAAGIADTTNSLVERNQALCKASEQTSRSADEVSASIGEADENLRKIFRNISLIDGAIHHTSLLIDSTGIPGEKLRKAAGALEIGAQPMDVESIKKAHLSWLGKLEGVIRGRSQLKPEEVASGRQCDFGKWYYSEGTERYGEIENFRAIESVHLRVHEMAREIVALSEEGNISEAEKQMDAFNAVKDQLFELLDLVYMEAVG
ncbi:MAG: CZB domain-containing protein [Magnetococcales bacterium]|nr:CZB domain-containing protein [Magnetococcales bacterium]